MAAESRAVVTAFVDDVLNAARPEALDGLVANEALAQRTAALRRAFPDLRVTVRAIACDGDIVAIHLSARGTHAGIFQGIPPTNRPWSASCTALYRVHGGRIVDFWATWDELAILEQIGGVARLAPASA